MIYKFGPHANEFFNLFGGEIAGIANSVWLLLDHGDRLSFTLHFTAWGRHLFAIGGNEQAARLTGVPVNSRQAAGLHLLLAHRRGRRRS